MLGNKNSLADLGGCDPPSPPWAAQRKAHKKKQAKTMYLVRCGQVANPQNHGSADATWHLKMHFINAYLCFSTKNTYSTDNLFDSLFLLHAQCYHIPIF